jgi:hypothetical protein
MIDALRQEAKGRNRRTIADDPEHEVPWDAVLRLPGVGEFANVAVSGGNARGKTPRCFLANQ